jgi:hypothetical protein
MNPLIQLKQTTLQCVVTLGLACFGFTPRAQAVVPPPDGCYPNYTTAEGCDALSLLTTGAGNTGLGWRSLFLDTTGSFNTGVGGGALALNNADSNTAVGAAALLLNTAGTLNVAVGTDALVFNDTGNDNTAVGAFALENNTASNNTAVGFAALFGNTLGTGNTANGTSALSLNDIGDFNTAVGVGALHSNASGSNNAAIGFDALFNNTIGGGNSAFGDLALQVLASGDNNTALGHHTATGLQTGSGNVYLGAGVFGDVAEDNHTYIRNINTTSVSGGSTDTVTVNLTTGLLGHLSSSRRYKEDIKPMDKTSEALYRLNPVTYCYKKEIDPTQSPAFGLIAEEVADVNPELVACNADGQPESVHYEMINAMLLNEFLKEHREVQELKKQVAALTAGLQKVSAQLAAASPSLADLK